MVCLKVKFANIAEIEYLTALETEKYWNGSTRRTLNIECSADAMDANALNEILNDEANTATLTLSNTETGTENIYDGYVLKLKVSTEQVLVNRETNEYESRIFLKLGQRTFIEEQIKQILSTQTQGTNVT